MAEHEISQSIHLLDSRVNKLEALPSYINPFAGMSKAELETMEAMKTRITSLESSNVLQSALIQGLRGEIQALRDQLNKPVPSAPSAPPAVYPGPPQPPSAPPVVYPGPPQPPSAPQVPYPYPSAPPGYPPYPGGPSAPDASMWYMPPQGSSGGTVRPTKSSHTVEARLGRLNSKYRNFIQEAERLKALS